MNISSKIKEFKTDIIVFSTLTILFFALLMLFWGHLGSIIIDSGKEAYYPQQMLQGKIFGKDIFAVYGPVSYQLNTLLFMIFGENLSVLYTAGAINAFSILLLTYIISRQLTSYETSWIICYFIIVVFFFNNSVSNYIFPYTYAIIYALNFFLISLLLCMLYIKFSQPIYIPISALFLSLSIFSKFEFILFLFVLAYIIFVYKKLQAKYILYSILSFSLVPIISIGCLFIQGLSYYDVISYLKYNVALSQSKNMQLFYTYAVGFYPDKEMIFKTLSYFKEFCISFLTLFIVIYFILLLIKSLHHLFKSFIIAILIISITIYMFYLSNMVSKELIVGYLCWLPMMNLIIFVFFLLRPLIQTNEINKHNTDNKTEKLFEKLKNLNKIDDKRMLYITLLAAAVISTSKCLFYVGLQVYGPFLLLLPFAATIIFIVDYIPELIKSVNTTRYKQAIMLTIILGGLFFLFRTTIEIKNSYTYLVSTPRGSIYTETFLGEPYLKAIHYINKKILPGETLLVIPEGVSLNFLTNHPAGSLHINIMPIEMELFGEDKIIKDLTKNPPDYIFVNSRNYYGKIFGIHYGQKTFNYIIKNYSFQTLFGNGFRIVIFKKK